MHSLHFSSVQLLSRIWLFATLWTTAGQASLTITNNHNLLRLESIEEEMLSSHLILCCLPFLLPSIFCNESVRHIRRPKYWSFSFSFSPSNERSGLISFRIDWLDSIAVQATLMSLLHKHNSKASSSVLSFHYSPTLTSIHDKWKNHSFDKTDLCRQSKVLPFNMLSTLVITFLPMSKHLLISWLQSQSTITLKPPKLKFVTASTVSPSICHEVMGTDALILVFWILSFKPTFLLSCITFIKRLLSSSSLSAIRVVSSAYLRLLVFLLAVLILACASSSLPFLMVYSAYKLNKQHDNIENWHTLFQIWKQSVVPCPVLMVTSWPAYRFLRRQVRLSGIPISFRIFHRLLCFTHQSLWHCQ